MSDQQDTSRKIEQARRLLEQEVDAASALALSAEVLDVDFNDPLGLFLAGKCLQSTQRYGLAYNLFKRCSQLSPDRAEPWNMQGMCFQEMWKLDDAMRCFKESLKRNPRNHAALQNMALVHINRCEPDEALKYIAKAEEVGQTNENIDNKAMALLMKRDWSGWKYHRQTSGHSKQRPLRAYMDPEEPMWNGEPGTVVVYSNQGIGDEVAYASCIPDAAKKAEIILDCDERTAPLFRRSFPGVKVYGTRFKDERDWDHAVDYSIPIDCLPGLFRTKDDDFTGEPYLVADPERRLQWRALFDTYKKPVIGIAWTGGIKHTGSLKRSLSLEQLAPVFKAIDATWVSLEYRDRTQQMEELYTETGIKLLDFPRVVHAVDYDETAAMVAELDLVICVTTAVVHLAGALGKECWCIAPSMAPWLFGLEGNLPWYRSVEMFRQKQEWPIAEVANRLREKTWR